jgi:CubicO group peptidase (beta-lactamase class C family)
MITDLGRSTSLGSPGMFGWDGAATTLVYIDPAERMVALLLTQHMPYNEHGIFARFLNGLYGALAD